jgi:DMSO/TMAO reductase YedYZ heme-binding membrane subunit
MPEGTHNVMPEGTHNVMPEGTHNVMPEGTHNGVPERTRIVVWAFVVMFAAVAVVAWRHGGSEEGIRQVVRLSAEIGVVLFSLAFSASSLRIFWRTPASAWLLRNRRYVGLSFGSFHLLHLAALVALAIAFPDPFVGDLDPVTLMGGGIAYAFLVAQMITSNDASVRRLGRARWTLLHTVGSWLLWTLFVLSYAPRAVVESVFYVPFALIPLAAAGLRVARRSKQRAKSLAAYEAG